MLFDFPQLKTDEQKNPIARIKSMTSNDKKDTGIQAQIQKREDPALGVAMPVYDKKAKSAHKPPKISLAFSVLTRESR